MCSLTLWFAITRKLAKALPPKILQSSHARLVEGVCLVESDLERLQPSVDEWQLDRLEISLLTQQRGWTLTARNRKEYSLVDTN